MGGVCPGLLLSHGWIVYESIQRTDLHDVEVDVPLPVKDLDELYHALRGREADEKGGAVPEHAVLGRDEPVCVN